MKKRYTIKCAVFLLLTRLIGEKEEILLQRRYQTGLLAGLYDVSCSGHLEINETVKEAMIRETKEEIGIDITKEDLEMITTMHANVDNEEYIFITFHADFFEGIPTIMEPHKCDDLRWFDINHLPVNMSDTRIKMIEDYKKKISYDEYGF